MRMLSILYSICFDFLNPNENTGVPDSEGYLRTMVVPEDHAASSSASKCCKLEVYPLISVVSLLVILHLPLHS